MKKTINLSTVIESNDDEQIKETEIKKAKVEINENDYIDALVSYLYRCKSVSEEEYQRLMYDYKYNNRLSL